MDTLIPPAASRAGRPAAAAWYRVNGLRVASSRRLAQAPLAAPDPAGPDCTVIWHEPGHAAPLPDGAIVAGLPCPCPRHRGRLVIWVARGPGGTWLWHELAGTCHVAPDARRIDVAPELDADPAALELLVVGQVLTFVAHRLGRPSLHASAVVIDHGAAAFIGPPGRGKSTLAAMFMRRGSALLTDDVLPLERRADGVYGHPSVLHMKLWPVTAERLLGHCGDLAALTRTSPKRLLPIGGHLCASTHPVPIRAIYVLERYEAVSASHPDISIEPLRGHRALAALLSQTSSRAFLAPEECAGLLDLYARLIAQAPVRRVRFPTGFEHEEALHGRLIADLEEA